MTTMRIQLLGDVAVIGGDGVRTVHSPGLRTVLALLAVHAGDSVDRDAVIDEVWGDRLPQNPVTALHIQLTRLRAQLRDGATVRSSARRVTLDIDRAHVDLTAFLDTADTALRTGDRDLRAQALGLWQEPVLPGLHSPRLAAARAHVEERHRALQMT